MKKITLAAAAAMAVAAGVALHGSAQAPPRGTLTAATHASGLRRIHDPRHVTGTIHGHCKYRDHGKLPDPRCTPGSIDPAVTQAKVHTTICTTGYARKARPRQSQTKTFKNDVGYPAYREPPRIRTELDHLVPLELGGSNDATNLWPEAPPSPNPKDNVESALHRAVCAGRVGLAAAQDAIAADWLTAETKLHIPKR